MLSNEVLLILRGISAITKAKQVINDENIKADIDLLVEQLKPSLPTKPDGTAWTNDELHAAAESAKAPWQDVADLTGG